MQHTKIYTQAEWEKHCKQLTPREENILCIVTAFIYLELVLGYVLWQL